MEIFVAFGPYRLEIRNYTGCTTVPALAKDAENLRGEAKRLATAVGLPEPTEARVTSTYMGLTLICEIDQRGVGDTKHDAIRQFAKTHGWKISRK